MTDYLTLRQNTRINATTQYRDFDFNSLAVFNGQIIGANDSGIFTHSGDKDNGDDIYAYFLPNMTDFGDHRQKRVRKGFVGYQTDGTIRLTVYDDEGSGRAYRLEKIDSSKQHSNMVAFGRDGKGRYWQFKIENMDGADFTVLSIGLYK